VWLFASLSTEALSKLKRDGIVQAWWQKTLGEIKLKISKEKTWDSVSLRKYIFFFAVMGHELRAFTLS
jgi:hypothetical protein